MPSSPYTLNRILQLMDAPQVGPSVALPLQTKYLRDHLAPWLVEDPPRWLTGLHSYHFMRYFGTTAFPDPDAPGKTLEGVLVVLRFLGKKRKLRRIVSSVDTQLRRHQEEGTVVRLFREEVKPWKAVDPYGGLTVTSAFASFLAGASDLTLRRVLASSPDPLLDQYVLPNWTHCFNLITTGLG